MFRQSATLVIRPAHFSSQGQANMPTINSNGASEPMTPTDDEVSLAREAGRHLAKLAALDEPVEVKVKGSSTKGETLVLPASSLKLLADILEHLALGRG